MNINEGRAVVNFIKQALRNEPMTIYGDGKQTRSFCFIDDQVKGQVLAMDKEDTKGEVINIGNSVEKTILEFAETIKAISEPLPQDDPHQRKPDISKAKRLLGWEPTVSLEDGLAKTIDYFRGSI